MDVTDTMADDAGNDIEVRKRRAAYRSNYRGTKEMDWLLGKFAADALPAMDADELAVFEQFLALADPDIQKWLTDVPTIEPVTPPDPAFKELIGRIRKFHGLSAVGV
jgi:antitoxin CptB